MEPIKAIINNTLLSNIKPAAKQYDIWDTKLTGFILRVSPNGNMVYRCEYERGKHITVGNAKILTPIQARDRAKEILADAVKGIDPRIYQKKPANLTLKSFIENEYKPWFEAHRKAGSKTIARITSCFYEAFGDKLLNDLTPILIDQWRTKKLKAERTTETVNRDVSALKAALAKAVEWNFIDAHPLAKLKQFKTDSLPKVRYLNEDEEQRLRNALDHREEKLRDARKRANQWREERGYDLFPYLDNEFFADHIKPMILLSINTGIRQGELFSLRWENIDFSTKTLTIEGKLTKSSKTRHIPLNIEAYGVLSIWRKITADNNILIFQNRDGNKFDNVKKAWVNLLKAAEINNFRWHDIRHHFASRLVMAGVDLNTVRELIGHSDIKMTLRYAHLAPEHKAEAVARLVKKIPFDVHNKESECQKN